MLYLKTIFSTQMEKLYNPTKLLNLDSIEPSMYRKIFPPVMHGTLAYQIFAVCVLIICIFLIILFLRLIYKQYRLAKQNVDTFELKDHSSHKNDNDKKRPN